MQSVAIVGVGLIGGSFGLGLRKAGFAGRILGVSSQRSIDEGVARGAIDRGVSLEEAASCSDLLLLSQPVSGIMETIRQLDALVRPGMLVTDVGSTKRRIVETAGKYLTRCEFLGGHPMAGKEVRGAAAATADLFVGRPWVLTSDSSHPVAQAFRQWIGAMGAREIILDPAAHDRLVAWGSHLPQLVSTALASVLHDRMPEAATIAGTGLLDMTRLAMSSFDLWNDILATNAAPVSEALDAYIATLQVLRADYVKHFASGSEFACSIPRPGRSQPPV